MLKYHDLDEIQESEIIEEREFYTYETKISVEDETKINNLIENCKEVIDITKEIIFN